MLNDITTLLASKKERLRRKQKLDAMLVESKKMLSIEQQKCRRTKQVLKDEQADVEKLEGMSLTGIFYSLLGTKQDRIDAEKQEYLAAKLKHEESLEAVEQLQQDVTQLQVQLSEYESAETDYYKLIEEKEKRIAQLGNDNAQMLFSFSERIADLKADQREIEEAIEAGLLAKSSLEQVKDELRSAENWGTWDMLGGGLVSTMAKHSKIDSAKRQAQIAQRQLRSFQEELADADRRLHVSLDDIGGFSKFADYFLDGLIFDWVVQSKLQKASEACRQTISKVTNAISECRSMHAETTRTLKKTEVEKLAFIEQSG